MRFSTISARMLWVAALGVLSLGVVPSCARTSVSGTDSNTHWLDQCRTDKDCGSLVCRCGACTKPCVAPADCTSLGGDTSCAAEVCDTGVKVCIASCNTPADCPHGGAGFGCTNNRCVATGTGSQGGTCATGTVSGGACSADAQCWTPCNGGSRGQFVCSGGHWLAGQGLFPCGSDAGTPVGTGGICPGRVNSGAPCGAGDVQCWTECTNDLQSQFVCGGGQWLAGKGLFPCGGVDSGKPAPCPGGLYHDIVLPPSSYDASTFGCHATRELAPFGWIAPGPLPACAGTNDRCEYPPGYLPCGTCADPGYACQMSVTAACDCGQGPFLDKYSDQWACKCESGKWDCRIVAPSGASCFMNCPDSGPRQNDASVDARRLPSP
jgi:hypothetical protein